MTKKVLILFDLEGCAGIDGLQNLKADYYLYCKECDLVLSMLSQIYPEWELSVCDCHGNGIVLSSLTYVFPDIRFYNMPWNIDFTENYDYAMLFGFHGHNHTKDPLAHSFRPEISNVRIGNKVVGEISIFHNLLAYYNIPCILINGSSYIEDEIADFKCVKSYIKHFGTYEKNCYLVDSYKNIVKDINKLLYFDFPFHISYDNATVSVKFIVSDYVTYLSEYTAICDDTLLFENTFDFFCNLKSLCTKISDYQNEKSTLIRQIYNFKGKPHLKKASVSCDMLKTLLNKPMPELSLNELQEVISLLKK